MSFHAKSGCPKHLVAVYERAVNALPTAFLLPPATGEVFDDIPACERRLRGLALAEGFDIAHTGGGYRRVPAGRWQCSQHGKETKNWRKLEVRVEYDEEGTITSKCQREGTNVSQLNCNWLVRVSYKDVGGRGQCEEKLVIVVS